MVNSDPFPGVPVPGQKATEAERREQILKAAYDVAVRHGIDGLTVRAVAARARLSHGLVLFHFKRKDQLGLALLDRVLETTVSLSVPDNINAIPDPRDRLQALFEHELRRFGEEPRRIRLFLEYWARGTHNAIIRAKISAGLADYRSALQRVAEEVLTSEGGRHHRSTPAGVAAAAVSLIIGYPVQALIDRNNFNVREYFAAAQDILGRLALAA
jgi:AcrR family transcriptional regulator